MRKRHVASVAEKPPHATAAVVVVDDETRRAVPTRTERTAAVLCKQDRPIVVGADAVSAPQVAIKLPFHGVNALDSRARPASHGRENGSLNPLGPLAICTTLGDAQLAAQRFGSGRIDM